MASAFAVASLAIQLVETGEKISNFLTSVQDMPNEVIRLGQTLDRLNGTLKQVSYLPEQQYQDLRLPGSPVFIMNALKNCENRIKALEGVIQTAKANINHRNRMHRSWAAIRFVLKKEDIREMQTRLHEAEAGLQTAMLSNLWQLQYVSKAQDPFDTADYKSECIPSVSQAPSLHELQRSKRNHSQILSVLYHDKKEGKIEPSLQGVPLVLLAERHVRSGIRASSDVSILSPSQLL